MGATKKDVKTDVSVGVPDGGWGWFIVLAVFVGNLLIDGVVGCFGLLYPEILKEFGASPAVTSLAGSSLVGVFLFSSLLWGGCIRIYGCRLVCFVGGCVCCLGFGLSMFSQTILSFILTYGILGGIGFGMNSISGHVIVNSYFNKRRGIAQGIVSSGAGAGVFLLAPIKQYTLVEFGWRGTMLIFAGIVLHFCVCACLMRTYNAGDRGDNFSVEESNKLVMKETEDDTYHNEKLLKDEKVLNLGINDGSKFQRTFTKSFDGFPNLEPSGKHQRKRTVSEYVPNEEHDNLLFAASLPNLAKSHARKENKSGSKVISPGLDPFMRKDILYSSSLYNLREFQESADMKSFLETMTIRDENDNENDTFSVFNSRSMCLSSLRVLVKHMCDLTVFRNKHFIPILVGAVFIQMSQFIPNTFIAEYGYSICLKEAEISIIISIYGVSNIFGRLSAGCLANIRGMNPLWLCNFGTVMCGLACILFPLCTSFVSLCLFAVGQGYFIGYFAPLQILILVQYLGLDKLTSSVGFLQMAKGPAAVLGPPLAGLVYGCTNNYGAAVQFAGVLSFIAAGIQSVAAVIDWCTEKRNRRQKKARMLEIIIQADDSSQETIDGGKHGKTSLNSKGSQAGRDSHTGR